MGLDLAVFLAFLSHVSFSHYCNPPSQQASLLWILIICYFIVFLKLL